MGSVPKSTRLGMGGAFPTNLSPPTSHGRKQTTVKCRSHLKTAPLPSVIHRNSRLLFWSSGSADLLLDTQVLLWLSWTERNLTPMRFDSHLSFISNFCQGTLSRTRLSFVFPWFFRRYETCPWRSIPLTCLSPIYLPNEKNVQKAKFQMSGGGLARGRFLKERESAGKRVKHQHTSLEGLFCPVNGAQVQTLAGITH